MLYKLLVSMHDEGLNSMVISLMDRGKITERIEKLGVKVIMLGLAQGERPSLKTIKKLKKFVASFNPDIVQGWMYHGNIAATLAVFLFDPMRKNVKLFWNVRQTLYDISNEKAQTRWLIMLGSWLSFFTHSVIYNSNLSAEQHCNAGFSKKKTKIIPNGFDLKKFHPDRNNSKQLRNELCISEETIIIGHISRLHPMKDHDTLFRSIECTLESLHGASSKQKVIFLLVGVTSELSNNKSIRFLGEQSNIPKIMSMLDIVVSSSAWGEGFPNVIGEAMASGVPCVVTDVGDSARIVGKYGIVCPAGGYQCISNSVTQLIENKQERKRMGMQARKRIKENYSIGEVKKSYIKEWIYS